MDATDESYDLPTLCDLAGVTPRTVRYYMQQGLLPQPGAGREARKYGPGTLMRLRLIRQLQREHLPLAEIRARLEPLSDEAVAGLVEPEPRSPREPLGSAREYLDTVLGAARARLPRGLLPDAKAGAMGSSGGGVPEGTPPPTFHPLVPRAASEPTEAWPRGREQWERLRLHADVELHVRRPASRDLNRRLERLLEEARRILNEE